ncbi:MAG: hypothetical protein AB1758_36770, partial [Candidatus Eremiobacterota bacterium]
GWLWSDEAEPEPTPVNHALLRSVTTSLARYHAETQRSPSSAQDQKRALETVEDEIRELQAGRPIYLSAEYAYKAYNLEEAAFFCFMKGYGDEHRMAHPELARSLKWLTEEGLALDSEWHTVEVPVTPFHKLMAGERVQLWLPGPKGGSEGATPMGAWSLHDMEPFERFHESFGDRLAAARELRASTSWSRSKLWTMMQDSDRDHQGQPMLVRARAAMAAQRFSPPEAVYEAFLRLPAETLQRARDLRGVDSVEAALQALEHLRTAPADLYLDSLRDQKDPPLAWKLSLLRQNPELEKAYEQIERELWRDQRGEVVRAWAACDGQVDLQPALARIKESERMAPLFARMWREVPREDHALFARLLVHDEVPFERVQAAFRAVQGDEGRLKAWLAWFAHMAGDAPVRAERSTELLTGMQASDFRDFDRVLQRIQGDFQGATQAWSVLRESPHRDLALTVYQASGSHDPTEVERLARVGYAEREAAVRALVEGGVPLEAALDASACPPGAYLEVRRHLPPTPDLDARCRAALRQLSPDEADHLAKSLGITRDLPTAVEMLQYDMATLEC